MINKQLIKFSCRISITGLTRGSSCRNARSIFDLPDRYMDDSDGYGASDDGVADRGCADATACKEKTPSYDEGAPSVHDSDDARSRGEYRSHTRGSSP